MSYIIKLFHIFPYLQFLYLPVYQFKVHVNNFILNNFIYLALQKQMWCTEDIYKKFVTQQPSIFLRLKI